MTDKELLIDYINQISEDDPFSLLDTVEYSCVQKSQIQKFGNQSSGTRTGAVFFSGLFISGDCKPHGKELQ